MALVRRKFNNSINCLDMALCFNSVLLKDLNFNKFLIILNYSRGSSYNDIMITNILSCDELTI